MNLDALGMLQELGDKGFTPSQAEGIVEQIMGAVANSDWVTKDFLRAELAELKTEIRTEMKTEKIDLIKWMTGLHIATLLATLSLLSGLIYFLLKNQL